MSKETESKEERAKGVSRQLNDQDPPKDTNPESLVGPTGGEEGEMAPGCRRKRRPTGRRHR